MAVREVEFGEEYGLEFCGEMYSFVGKTERGGGVRSNQFLDDTWTWRLSVSTVLMV